MIPIALGTCVFAGAEVQLETDGSSFCDTEPRALQSRERCHKPVTLDEVKGLAQLWRPSPRYREILRSAQNHSGAYFGNALILSVSCLTMSEKCGTIEPV